MTEPLFIRLSAVWFELVAGTARLRIAVDATRSQESFLAAVGSPTAYYRFDYVSTEDNGSHIFQAADQPFAGDTIGVPVFQFSSPRPVFVSGGVARDRGSMPVSRDDRRLAIDSVIRLRGQSNRPMREVLGEAAAVADFLDGFSAGYGAKATASAAA